MKLLMAVDDSPFAAEVVQAVVTQFRTAGAEVRVLHVLQPASAAAPPQMDSRYAPELEEQKKESDEWVKRVAGQVQSAGLTVESARVEIGDVREKILDAATEWGADLIVVGSHGRTGLKRLLLGSVAESVARHAGCSVQIVRRRMPS